MKDRRSHEGLSQSWRGQCPIATRRLRADTHRNTVMMDQLNHVVHQKIGNIKFFTPNYIDFVEDANKFPRKIFGLFKNLEVLLSEFTTAAETIFEREEKIE